MSDFSNPTDEERVNQERARVTEVQARYIDELMKKAHVVGVAMGLRKKISPFPGQFCLVVMVDQKVPLDQLMPEDRIPVDLEGIPVEIRETGSFAAF
jgi:hypothetical protein